MPVSGSARENVPLNNLNKNRRRRLIEHFLSGSTKSKLDQGALKEAAAVFSYSQKQATGVWKRYQQPAAGGVLVVDVRLKRREFPAGEASTSRNLKRPYSAGTIEEPHTTQRSVAAQLDIPHSTCEHNMKKLGLHSASRFPKPCLPPIPAKLGGCPQAHCAGYERPQVVCEPSTS